MLTNVTMFPVFQDSVEVDAWGLQGGRKDDLFVYDAEGRLSAYLPFNGELVTDLSEPEGHDNLWNTIMAAR